MIRTGITVDNMHIEATVMNSKLRLTWLVISHGDKRIKNDKIISLAQ